ncbi:MAG: hypothetical protein KG028_06685 [Actinobacteria bacterium]|jgi:hypothetical protein|nr:hypothetical protein [Actinomycetota bacterium]
MANQHRVRALIARDDLPTLRERLRDELDIDADHVRDTEPTPGEYRDEAPDLELSRMVGTYHRRGLLGGAAGAVLALLLVFVLPPLREFLPYSLILVFGGAWGGGIATAARAVQATKREDDLGESIHRVGAADAAGLREVTITVDRDREAVVNLLQELGATTLDSDHPRVGRGPGARPATPGQQSHSGDQVD